MIVEPYNPLDKQNLARSIEREIILRDPVPLAASDGAIGAGVYALYYIGEFLPYDKLRKINIGGAFSAPIYVGKAIPGGGRKGGLSGDASKGSAIRRRLAQHSSSIAETTNLDLADFYVRWLIVDDIWIPLGENALIETFKPLWNRALDGFGNNPAGAGREGQVKSPWDTLHPGRKRALKHNNSAPSEFFEKRVVDYLNGREMEPLPRNVRAQLDEEQTIAEEQANEV